MKIKDNFSFSDTVSGLKISVVKGKKQDRLHIDLVGQPKAGNRDFWFDKDGIYTGTGTALHGKLFEE